MKDRVLRILLSLLVLTWFISFAYTFATMRKESESVLGLVVAVFAFVPIVVVFIIGMLLLVGVFAVPAITDTAKWIWEGKR